MTDEQRKVISELLIRTKDCCNQLVKNIEGEYIIVDPIDGESIDGHYAASHAAVANLIFSQNFSDTKARDIAIKLISSIISRWNIISSEKDFHADFNLFALCLFYNNSENENIPEIREKIKKIVLSTNDSPHNTVNWLPMRMYVNKTRYEWTHNSKYKDKFNEIQNLLETASSNDFYIDDRIPLGISYNVQYNISTVAGLSILKDVNEEFNLAVFIDALVKIMLPDGDINYLGRGTNQIFAWGPWIYLLNSNDRIGELDATLKYFLNRIDDCLTNHNLLLNDSAGDEQRLWWDYHHFSVYVSHLYMWLSLSLKPNVKKNNVEKKAIKSQDMYSCGISITKKDSFMIVSFKGRKEYLAETGPAIYALWTKKNGIVFKGIFAPWFGAFGNKYSNMVAAIYNYFGLMELRHDESHADNRVLRRLNIIEQCHAWMQTKPIYSNINIQEDEKKLFVTLLNKKKKNVFMNIPSLKSVHRNDIKVYADNVEMQLLNNFSIYNQYGHCAIYQTMISQAEVWKIEIQTE